MQEESDDDEIAEQFKASQYEETARERTIVRGCGVCCCVVAVLLSLTYAFAAFPIASVTDAPAFARTLLWLSVAHHTDAWREYRVDTLPPPSPPTFT